MLAKSVVTAWFSVVVCTYPVSASDKHELNKIDNLFSSGKTEQALSEILRLRKTLPLPERLTAWELEFRGEVLQVAHGRECLYYQLHLSNSQKDAPGRQGALDSISAALEHSDRQYVVICVDLKTGQIRWSRAINGLVHLAVNPRDDVLYLYNKRFLALAPDSGKVLEQHELPESRRKIQGLLLGNILAIHRHRTLGDSLVSPDAQLLLYDPSSKLTKEVDAADYCLIAPDESKRLVSTGSGWICVSVPDGRKMWSFETPFNSAYAPLWHRGHPTFVTGTERQRGAVTSIDQSTGKVRWSAVLGWGSYESHMHQLRGGGYPDRWIPLTAIDKYLLTVDGSGRLYFIDPADGKIDATARLCSNLLGMPFQYEGQLIVSSFNWIRSYAIANLIDPETSLEAALQLREARCLLALGQQEEAMEVLDQLAERAPGFGSGWAVRAEVCKAMNDVEEEVFSSCRALSLSGQTSNDALRGRCGLLRLYNLKGKPCWSPAHVDDKVYVGTLAGGLWSTQTNSLDLDLVASLDHEVASLETETDLLAVLGDSHRSKQSITKELTKPDDRVPSGWYTLGGEYRISRAVSYRGRQFRSMKGGGVRVLSGTEMNDLPPLLEDIDEWNIHLSPFGPLGYGNGVFELDADLRPVRWLIRPAMGGERPKWTKVMFMQSTSKTIGLVMSSAKGAALQVYSYEGVLLNEAALGRFVSGWARPSQLISMGDGYMFSDRQLVWISSAADRRVWKFGPSLARTSTKKPRDRWEYFGVPLLSNGCLYITGLDGHLYIFDSNRVTGIGH